MEKIKFHYEEYVEIFNKKINEYLPQDNNAVCEAMRYAVGNGGKRIRPLLTLAFCWLCGGEPTDAIPFACAIEFIHTYSLIHDDLPCMDDDCLRRGKPSCHVQFGEAIALLAGDALLTLAFNVLMRADNLSDEKRVKAGRELSRAAGYSGMIGGQMYDIQNEGKNVSIDMLETTEILKTGELISAAAVLGCIAGGAEDKYIAIARLFAKNIGLAFQIQDDILDATGDAETLGKTAGIDIKNNKSTYVSKMGLEASENIVRVLTEEAVQQIQMFGKKSEWFCDFAKNLANRRR